MLQICDHPGCTTLTLGSLCLVHEPAVTPRRYPRGRPHPGEPLVTAAVAARFGRFAPPADDELGPLRTVSLGGGT